ncbi:hypothetical protein EfmAA242_32990 (plasmid) [Enterococcus faecium]|nr:hypothetical protein EfmAA242_32990 [Enterococcus faecium]
MKNAALARRFNDVVINEPTAADTLRILQGVKELYEKHHTVSEMRTLAAAPTANGVFFIGQNLLLPLYPKFLLDYFHQ